MRRLLVPLLVSITLFSGAWAQQAPIKTVLKINLTASTEEKIYRDSIHLSVDHPNVKIMSWGTSKPTQMFDGNKKKKVPVFSGPFTLTANLEAPESQEGKLGAKLHLLYQTTKQKKPIKKTFDVVFNSKIDPIVNEHSEVRSEIASKKVAKKNLSWSSKISSLLDVTDKLWVRILLIYLLGLLMSLTPCIYPMIPITLGALQASGTRSIFNNFLLAFSYATGLAMVFATMGIIAASGGQWFGSLMGRPWFIMILIAFFLYMAFSILGFYNLYIPAFMQPRAGQIKRGSFISAFIFGAASGTVASPCISPGLAAVLGIVITIGNKYLGFLLLLIFGYGIGTPLMIIGTFSTSLSAMPKAGSWMNEVKKIFAFMLFGICYFYLSNIVSWTVLLWLMSAGALTSGIYFFASIKKMDTKSVRWYKNIMGLIFVIGSVGLVTQAIKAHLGLVKEVASPAWQHDYQASLKQAQAENKKVLLDFTTSYCSLCKAIDRKIINTTPVMNAIKQVVPVKVDGTDPNTQPYKMLSKRYKVIGAPTFLLINTDEKLIKRWDGAIHDDTPEAFAQELLTAIK
ncbi:thioredoxin fold domain-containing protein [bacterium]|jgi:thioredoxin:protein disulfide reductase|nr:thioredoxin fold domain-containing protein [bacterium]MBT3903510.1 thioredoxin fold domain-containing protein [bacterium]MBT4578208.1 thioredoxin fold domain-containing protein [bacterium]MBT5345447.1 thioredoxin fold domain-containing protein [bacterium]MBT6131141.1 thioredoxin fold domain-containing protein [bacterium]